MTSLDDLAVEIKAMILSVMPNLQSLLNLVSADPIARSEFLYSSNSILPSVLGNCLPRDIQEAVCTCLTLDEAGLINDSEVEVILNSLDQKSKNLRLPVKIRDPVAAIENIKETQEAINNFTWAFARRLCHQPHFLGKLHDPDEPALTSVEIHRINRTLWRLEVFCRLSAAWKDSEVESNPKVPRQKFHLRFRMYLQQFKSWELEEFQSVYAHITVLMRRDPQNPLVGAKGHEINSFRAPMEIFNYYRGDGLPDSAISRGLKYLYVALHRILTVERVKGLCQSEYNFGFGQTWMWDRVEFFISALLALQEQHKCIDRHLACKTEFVCLSERGANVRNFAFYCKGRPDTHWAPPFFRNFGLCMWDEPRLQRWGVLGNYEHGKRLSAAKCKDAYIQAFTTLAAIPPPLHQNNFT